MQMNDPVQELKTLLPLEELPTVLAALHTDNLVWQQLGDPEIFMRARDIAGSQAALWNPATLALSALGEQDLVTTISSLPLQPLSPELRQRAVQAYEEMLRNPQPVAALPAAGLIALAFRERRRLTDSWLGLPAELQGKTASGNPVAWDIWETPFACLIHLTPDPTQLMRAMITGSTSAEIPQRAHLILHALFSNPANTQEQVRILTSLLNSEPVEVQTAFLACLREVGTPEVYRQLSAVLVRSKSILELASSSGLRQEKSPHPSDSLGSVEPLTRIVDRQMLARFYQEAGKPDDSLQLLHAIQEGLRTYDADLSLQVARIAAQRNDLNGAVQNIQRALELAPGSTHARLDLAEKFLQLGHIDEAAAAIPTDTSDARSMLLRSVVAAQSENLTLAREYALHAARNPGALSKEGLKNLISQLLKLGMPAEAEQASEFAIKSYPSDYQFYQLLGQAQLGENHTGQAVKTAQLVTILSPKDPAAHRTAAETYEGAGLWEDCLAERKLVLSHSPTAQVSDLHALAASAIKANQPHEAALAGQAALAQNPDDGLAHTYLGEAALMQNDPQTAAAEYRQGTLLLPGDSRPWIGLSWAYQALGDSQKSLEVLRSGAQAAPHNAEILIALGQACLAHGMPTEALPALRRAAVLAPQSPDLSLQLGETLYNLGRLDESREVLARGRNYWPNHTGLALAEGKTLLSLGDIGSALEALETVLRENPTEPEPYMLYAQSILDLSRDKRMAFSSASPRTVRDISLAYTSLQKALELDPQNFEARVLMGEAQASNGMLQEAMNTYLELSDQEEAATPKWNGRIHLGMGRVAQSLGEMDTAIAALQEALQASPDDLEINQTLAEAYLAAKFNEEATIQARTSLAMAPDNVDNLLWYGGVMLQMKEELDAVNALEHAIEIAPQRADLRLSLAHLQMEIKDNSAARKTLKGIFEASQANSEEMSQAAGMLYELGETASAVSGLQKAIASSSHPSATLWAKLADLQNEAGNPAEALESVQTALEIQPLDAGLHFLHGVLLSNLSQKQAAIIAFQQALDLAEQSPEKLWSYQDESMQPKSLRLRIASLLRTDGDLRTALGFAREAIAKDPDGVDARYVAADLAAALLDNRLALQLSSSSEKSAEPVPQASPVEDPQVLSQLLCLRSELEMENGSEEQAVADLARAAELTPESPRVLADRARLSGLQGDFRTGMDLLESALSHLGGQPECRDGCDPTLQIAEAALALHQWNTAIPLYSQVIRSAPMEARPHLYLARAMARAAEYIPQYRDLKAVRHAPGLDSLSEKMQHDFEQEIQTAENLSNQDEIDYWNHRGMAAFEPQYTSEYMDSVLQETPDLAAEIASPIATEEPGAAASTGKLSPDRLEGLFRKGLSQMESQPDAAYAAAQALVSQKPGNPLYQALYASTARRAKAYSESLGSIQAALATWPDEPYWHEFAAETAEECGLVGQALEHWEQASALEPDNPVFTSSLGRTILKTGNVQKAISVLEQAASMDPSSSSVWENLAAAYRVNKNYADAIGSAEKAIRLSPNEISPLVLSGEIALEAKQFELGIQRAKEILGLIPQHPKGVILLSKSERAQGKPAVALQILEDSLASQSEPFEILLERGRLIRQLHGPAAALEAFQSLAQQYPGQPEALAEHAVALADAGHGSAAEKAAQAALKLDPNQPDLHLLLGRIQHANGQLDQAIHHLSEAAQLAPDNIEIYLEMGKTYSDRREQTQALKIYQQAFAIAPEDARPYYLAGLALKDSKDYVMAETMLRRAAGLAPEDVNIRRQLAAIIAINLVHNPQEAPTLR